MHKNTKFLLPVSALLIATQAYGLAFTINATVASDPTGTYTVGQSVSYTYTANPTLTLSGSSSDYSASALFHRTEATSDESVLTDISGTSLTGAWELPNSSLGAPFDYIYFTNSNSFWLLGASDTGESLGLQLGGNDVTVLYFVGTYTGLTYSDPGSYEDPGTYYTPLSGTYSIDSQDNAYMSTTGGTVQFNITSLTIGAIPEPSSAGLLVGLGALGFIARRRR